MHQKRLPRGAPPWVETVRLHFPRYGLHADELCVTRLADVAWAVQMSTVEFHPWNSRRADTEKPDEWRIDLDPMPDAPFSRVRRAAHVAHEVLDELGAVGWPKTSGGHGLHVYVRIRPDHGFGDVRRAALAFAREVERRLPDDVTTTWWRKDRDPEAVFVDYNQNARDHTIAAAYSVRGNDIGTVSTPFRWDELDDVEPNDFTIATVPQRYRRARRPARRHRRRRLRHRAAAGVGRARRGRRRRAAARARGRHGEALMDLVVPPGPGVPQGLTVPGDVLVERFSRSSGPGGQGVNTADSRVELELDVVAFDGFTETQRDRVLRALDPRLVGGRLLVVAASEHRQQRRNRVAARERMADLLRDAMAPPPAPRRATRPTRGLEGAAALGQEAAG